MNLHIHIPFDLSDTRGYHHSLYHNVTNIVSFVQVYLSNRFGHSFHITHKLRIHSLFDPHRKSVYSFESIDLHIVPVLLGFLFADTVLGFLRVLLLSWHWAKKNCLAYQYVELALNSVVCVLSFF